MEINAFNHRFRWADRQEANGQLLPLQGLRQSNPDAHVVQKSPIVGHVYDDLSSRLEPKLYPSLAAVYNVYQEALKQDEKNGDAAKIHPLALWNMNFLREIDDSGFVKDLYKKNPQMLNGYGG